jgi:hypothetical protein
MKLILMGEAAHRRAGGGGGGGFGLLWEIKIFCFIEKI